MKSALKTLVAAYENPHQAVLEHRGDPSPVFGHLTEHVPLELLHAAGILPVRIQSGVAAGMASAHLQTFSCSFCRAAIHQEVRGDYHYLNGLVSSKTCDTALSLFQLWTDRRVMEFSWLLSLPGNSDEGAVDYFTGELLAFKKALELYQDKEIGEKEITEAILLYNGIREMVEGLWEKSRKGTTSLSVKEIVASLKGCQVLPPPSALALLKALVEGEEDRTETSANRTPLMLLGGTFHDISIIDVIEKGGGRVMVDDTLAGGRSFGEAITHSGDPIRSLARYYLSKATGPYRLDYDMRRDRVLELARGYGLRGCIHVMQKFCDPCLFETPLLVEDLKVEGIPSLVLEIDDTAYSAGQVTTRIEAFLEML
jgi:benzoyl-CoA reductase subunit C